jgi:hypothetical protein
MAGAIPSALTLESIVSSVAGLFGNPFVLATVAALSAIKIFPMVKAKLFKGAGLK